MNSPLGFIIALQAERASLTRHKISHHTPTQLASGHWVILSGVGAWNAHHAARKLLKHGVSGLVSWGSAGSLTDTLHPGHLVIPESILGATGDVYTADAEWRGRLIAALTTLPLAGGLLTESLCTIAHPRDKLALNTRTNAVAVDMESAAIAAVARHSEVPFVAIRAIADTASMTLPRSVSLSINTSGKLCLHKLMWHAALRPDEWMALKQLSTAFAAAHQTLQTVNEQAVDQHFYFTRPGICT
ncbi:MAG: hypothetical protein ACR2HF_11455 [Methylococcaceae bacterium]